MSFLDSCKAGVLTPLQSMHMVWRHKELMWYGLWHVIAHFVTCWAVIRCGLHVYGAMQMCYLFAFPGISCIARDAWCVATAVVVALLLAYTVMIIFALLTKKVLGYVRGMKLSVRDCVLPLRAYGWLFVIALCFAAAATVITVFITMIPLWVAIVTYALWYMIAILAVPVFVDQRSTAWYAFKAAFMLVWRNFVAVFVALLSTAVVLVACGAITFWLSVAVTQAVCELLSAQVCMALMLPFMLQMVPWVFVSWFLITVAMVVPALMYEHVK